ncbi:MAG: hypothetical protein JW860_13950 [Sedimentisphaerales bacterium]|nr:hypothetical protein [Sedimentisphaerales bacterium]
MSEAKKHADIRILIIVATGLFVFLYLAALSNQYKPTPDSSEYMGLGYSLSQGNGFIFNGSLGSIYPPLMPILIAAVLKATAFWQITSLSILVLKLTQLALLVMFVTGSVFLMQKVVSRTWAIVGGFLILANITAFQHCQFIVSDILYACLSVWALVLIDQQARWNRWLGAILLIALACLARSVGIFLVLATVAWLLFGRCRDLTVKSRLSRIAILLCISVPPFAYWKLYHSVQADYLSYWLSATGETTLPGIILNRWQEMLPILPQRSAQILMNIEQPGIPLYFALIPFIFVIVGWFKLFIQRRGPLEWYALFYAGIMSIWFEQGTRFYLPVLPLLLLYGMIGCRWLYEQMKRLNITSVVLKILSLLALLTLTWPLTEFLTDKHIPHDTLTFLRSGIIYSCAAAGILLLILARTIFWKGKVPIAQTALGLFAGIYVSLALLYTAGYGLLEHGLIKSRGPMLAGFQPYYNMGLWLKDQPDIAEPVLCAQASIVHLAGAKLTCPPPGSQEIILENIKNNKYQNILLLEQTTAPPCEKNQQLWQLINDNPNQFKKIHSTSRQNASFHLYQHK